MTHILNNQHMQDELGIEAFLESAFQCEECDSDAEAEETETGRLVIRCTNNHCGLAWYLSREQAAAAVEEGEEFFGPFTLV